MQHAGPGTLVQAALVLHPPLEGIIRVIKERRVPTDAPILIIIITSLLIATRQTPLT